jgi:hypothetical protein
MNFFNQEGENKLMNDEIGTWFKIKCPYIATYFDHFMYNDFQCVIVECMNASLESYLMSLSVVMEIDVYILFWRLFFPF